MDASIIVGTRHARPGRRRVGIPALLAVGSVLAVVAFVQPVAGADKEKLSTADLPKIKQESSFYDKQGELESGKGKLKRSVDEIAVAVSSTLIPGDAATVWWIIFNDPTRCDGDELSRRLGYRCGVGDREKDHASMLYAGGAIAGPDGRYELRAELKPNDLSNVAMGIGLVDPYRAEVHAAIRTHGQASPDKAVLHSQLTTMDGGCTSSLPDSDPMRGIPGGNTCKTLRSTFFVGMTWMTPGDMDSQ